MAAKETKYFLAIVPEKPLYDEIHAIKEAIGLAYHTRGALRSPAHITLHMPFLWNEAKEEKLSLLLGDFAEKHKPVSLTLNGFASFPPRVVFIAVEENPDLVILQHELFKFCKMRLNLFNANYQDRPFHPHITLAFRDLRKDQFKILWREMEHKPFHASFVADKIALLKHDGQRWNVHERIKLALIDN